VIFAISVGSDGTGVDRFVLYVPFELAPGCKISRIDPSVSHNLCGYDLRFEELTHFCALTVGPFNTEDAAREFFSKLRSGLLWASLKNKAGIGYRKSIGDVKLYEEPITVTETGNLAFLLKSPGWMALDGDYKADQTVIRPEAKKLTRLEMGRGSVELGTPAPAFAECIAEALSFGSPESVLFDEKLSLAIELYSTSFFELSNNAKFIRLVTVLEALTPGSDVPKVCKVALTGAKNAVKEARKKHCVGSEERANLDHLLSRLGSLREQAIGTSMRLYVSEVVRQNPDLGDAEEVSDKLRAAYEHRSRLLHDGHANEDAVREALTFLRDFLPKFLERLYVSRANG
jgi:hypothetical protein